MSDGRVVQWVPREHTNTFADVVELRRSFQRRGRLPKRCSLHACERQVTHQCRSLSWLLAVCIQSTSVFVAPMFANTKGIPSSHARPKLSAESVDLPLGCALVASGFPGLAVALASLRTLAAALDIRWSPSRPTTRQPSERHGFRLGRRCRRVRGSSNSGGDSRKQGIRRPNQADIAPLGLLRLLVGEYAANDLCPGTFRPKSGTYQNVIKGSCEQCVRRAGHVTSKNRAWLSCPRSRHLLEGLTRS